MQFPQKCNKFIGSNQPFNNLMLMDIYIWFIGVLMIGLGFLVRFAPDLIAGYNTMPAEKKKNVDVEGLSAFLRNGLVVIGMLIIVCYYVFKWMGLNSVAEIVVPIVVLGGVLFMLIHARKYDHNKK